MKNALFYLYKKVWQEEKIPETWTHTKVTQIYKGKGNILDQKSMRNLHMKEDLVKMFGHLVLSSAKETLLKNMGMFQIGAKSGHRASEHIFVMKSFMQMYDFLKKTLIVCY